METNETFRKTVLEVLKITPKFDFFKLASLTFFKNLFFFILEKKTRSRVLFFCNCFLLFLQQITKGNTYNN